MATSTTRKKTATQASLADVISVESEDVALDLSKTTPGQIKIDDHAIINVKSNVFGELIYIDKRTQEETKWSSCGSVQPMTFGALRNMKASSVSFYKNQWIIITGFADENADKYTPADIYKALFITQYYQNLVEPSDYRTVCSWTAEEIAEKVSLMSSESRANLAVALNTYIEKGFLDSLKRIRAFEEALGCDLKMPE